MAQAGFARGDYRGPVRGTPHIPSAEFRVEGSNGYSIYVKSERENLDVTVTDRRPPQVFVSEKGEVVPATTGNLAASTYHAYDLIHGANAIEGDLGALGEISVAFHPSGKTRIARLDRTRGAWTCTAPARIVRRLGTFTGTIRFAGENGFTAVDVSSATGSVGTSPAPSCSDVRHPHPPPIYRSRAAGGGALELAAVDGGGPTTGAAQFSAARNGRWVDFRASRTDQFVPHLFVSRVAQARGRPNSFSSPRSMSFASVTPPAPFSGQGEFRPNDLPFPANEWSGSLSVSFPGIDVPLAGPAFTAVLRHLP
jgi:hypothetical protein